MKEEMERLYGSERIEDTKGEKKRSFKKIKKKNQHRYELKETMVPCSRSAGVCVRWGPRTEK